MDKKNIQLHTHADTIRLSDAERENLRQRVLTYVEFHPVEVAMPLRTPGFSVWTLVSHAYTRVAAGALALTMVVATPVFAENSMPGDMLYPVKVRFNEELRATFASSSQEKIAWQIERVERRIAEAQTLAREGRLTAAAEAAIAASLRKHTESAIAELTRLAASDEAGAATAQAAFESALVTQSAALSADEPENDAPAVPSEGKELERNREMLAAIVETLEQLAEKRAAAAPETETAPAEENENETDAETEPVEGTANDAETEPEVDETEEAGAGEAE